MSQVKSPAVFGSHFRRSSILERIDYDSDLLEDRLQDSATEHVDPNQEERNRSRAKAAQHIELAALHLSKALPLLQPEDTERAGVIQHLEGIGLIRNELLGRNPLHEASGPTGYRRERKTPLSKAKQAAALDWICTTFLERGGLAPIPVKEIAERFQKSSEGMRSLLNDLVFDGQLILNANKVIGGYFPAPSALARHTQDDG